MNAYQEPFINSSARTEKGDPVIGTDSVVPQLLTWHAGPDGVCDWVGPSWAVFTGLSSDENVRQRWGQLVHAEDREYCRAAYQNACKARQPIKLRYRLRHKSGEYRMVVDVGAPVCDKVGVCVGYMGFCTTGLESAAQGDGLSEVDQRYHSMLHSIIDGVFGIDRDGKMTFMNQAAEDILGWTEFDLLGRNMHELIHYSHIDRTPFSREHCPVYQTLQDGRARKVDTEYYRRQDGTPVRVAYVSAPMRDGAGRVTGVTVTFRNITEQVCANERIRQAQEEQRVLLDSVPALILYKDRRNRILRVNQYAATVLGYACAELEGKTLEEIIPLDAAASYRDDCEVMQSGRPKKGIIERFFTRTCEERWLETDKIPYRDETGGITGVIVFSRDITQRRQAEQASRTHEAQFRALFEVASIGCSQVDKTGKFLRVSPKLCAMLGYTEAELVGRTFCEITHHDDCGQNLDLLAQLLQGTLKEVQFEKRYVRKDGSIWWGQLTCNLVPDTGNDQVTVMAIVYDITARKEAEQALVESEERWQFALSANEDGVWDWHAEESRAYVSDRYCEIFGYPPGGVMPSYDSWVQSIHSDDRDRVVAQMTAHLNGQVDAFRSEYRALHKDGSYRWLLGRGKVMRRSPGGEPLRVVGTLSDITAHKKLEQAFVESQLRWRFALEGNQDGVWDWDPITGHSYFSARWKSMLGYADEEIPSTYASWRSLLHPDDLVAVESRIRAYLSGRIEEYTTEYRMRAKDGAYRWILARGKIMGRREDGAPSRVVGTHTDITFLKQLQESLIASQRQFLQAFTYAPIGNALAGLDGSWISVNPALCRILGYSETELLGMKFQDVTHSEDLALDAMSVLHLLNGRIETYEVEKRFVTKVGSIVWAQLNISCVPDSEGRPSYFIVQAQDVTARKQAEAKLRHSEAQFASFMHNLQGLAWIKDDSGAYIYANEQWVLAVAGWKGADYSVIGKTDAEFMSAELAALSATSDREVIRLNQSVQQIEGLGLDKNAPVFLVTKFPIIQAESGKVYTGGLALDITERVRAEEELKQSRGRLQLLLAERERLSQDLHDNSIQMLYAMGMSLYECRNLLGSQGNLRQCRAVLKRSVERVNEVINRLRAHLMDGALLQGETPIELISEIRRMLKHANCIGKTKIVAELSVVAVKRLGRGQVMEVLSIVREAVSNLQRHADARHGKVVLKCMDRSILLEISDDGRGGAAVVAKSSKRGHGVSNIQARVVKMNARLMLSSKKNAGTRIRIVIPREGNHAG